MSAILQSPSSASSADNRVSLDAEEDRRIWGYSVSIEDADAESDINVNARGWIGSDPFGADLGEWVNQSEGFVFHFDAMLNFEAADGTGGGLGSAVHSETFPVHFDWERGRTLTFHYEDATTDQATHGELIVWYTEEGCPSRC